MERKKFVHSSSSLLELARRKKEIGVLLFFFLSFPPSLSLRVKSLDVSIFDDRGRHPGN